MASWKLQSSTQVCNNDAFTFHGAPDLPLSLGEQWMKCKQLSIWRVMVASRRGYDCPMIILWNRIPSSHEHKPPNPAWQCGTCDWITTARTMESSRSESKQHTCDAAGGLTREVAFPSTTLWRTPYIHDYTYYTTCRIMHTSILMPYALCAWFSYRLGIFLAPSLGCSGLDWHASASKFIKAWCEHMWKAADLCNPNEKSTTLRSNKVNFRFQIFQLDPFGASTATNMTKSFFFLSRLLWRPGARSESSATVAGCIPIYLSIRVESLFLETSIDDSLSACWCPWGPFR